MQYLLQTVKHDCNVAKLGAGDIMLGNAEHGAKKIVRDGGGELQHGGGGEGNYVGRHWYWR